jgi:hypothetical protein
MIDYENLKKLVNCNKRITEIIKDMVPEYYKIHDTKPQPKFTIGDRVYYPRCFKNESYPVIDWSEVLEVNERTYGLMRVEVPHDLCFSSPEELVEAQFRHWNMIKKAMNDD